ncbi:type I-F CRISPR-associated protein Csy1 [Pseudomonas sp. 21LCFQ010]|uniref:type I-F CRISPR-associated protein Csy1 n=1 Tax=Pseudomonas sp. 21LCFQ010 TaxID=2957506 RepID=UPI00209823EC|nr:type I-F CRISPR-associated protein Csy1 [Pseudomonas sp. 21LCFQ010]MCO8161526.1 type I-F CRISPR-associated protein Csy1 [Pseudomonas sp. 21LCFQ010]
MDEGSKATTRSTRFREAISAFINDRKEAKLKGSDDIETVAKYDYSIWLADAVRRSEQIKIVTHPVKATHGDIKKATSIHVVPTSLPQHTEIGTHNLGEDYSVDVAGNAAALDVYKFLKLEIENRQILDWLHDNDADLLLALDADPVTANEWAETFKNLIRPATTLVSHVLAKQLYWCTSGEPADNTGFHLLQPLASSSLAHTVHQDINDARFGEVNKAARQARRDGKHHEDQYHDYRNLVVRKLGGTKPQNISQLNTERGGVNYLLACTPPQWRQAKFPKLLRIETIFSRFRWHDSVPEQLKELTTLLKSDPPKIKPTRLTREALEQALGQSLAEFGLITRELFGAGWTRSPDCKLSLHEQLWLDPERCKLELRDSHLEEDQAFNAAFLWEDWPAQVAHAFGQWLNAYLREQGLPVGDTEQVHWAKQAIVDADRPVPSGLLSLAKAREEVNHG